MQIKLEKKLKIELKKIKIPVKMGPYRSKERREINIMKITENQRKKVQHRGHKVLQDNFVNFVCTTPLGGGIRFGRARYFRAEQAVPRGRSS